MKRVLIIFLLFLTLISCQKTPGRFIVDVDFPALLKTEVESGEKSYFTVAKLLNCKGAEDTECSEKSIDAVESGKLINSLSDITLTWNELTYDKNKRLYVEFNEFVDGKTVHIYSGNSPLFNLESGKTTKIKEFFWQDGKRDILNEFTQSFTFNISPPDLYIENRNPKTEYYFKTVLSECDESDCNETFSIKYKKVDFDNLTVDFVGIENPENVKAQVYITTSTKDEDCPELEGTLNLLSGQTTEDNTTLNFSPCKLFRNTELRQCVRVALGKYDNTLPISYEELQSLKILDCENRHVQKIEGIEVLQNLEALDLNANRIYTIDELRYLTKITVLVVGSNHILDFTPIENLDLTFFSAGKNYNKSVQVLQNFKNLTGLVIESNYISDFSFLKNLTKLKRLNIERQSVDEIDIDAIQYLENLEELYINQNRIKDFLPISSLKKLKWLFAEDVQLKDPSFLKELDAIKQLHLANNEISDPTFLDDMQELYYVDLDSNCFDDVSVSNKPKFFYHTGKNPACTNSK